MQTPATRTPAPLNNAHASPSVPPAHGTVGDVHVDVAVAGGDVVLARVGVDGGTVVLGDVVGAGVGAGVGGMHVPDALQTPSMSVLVVVSVARF